MKILQKKIIILIVGLLLTNTIFAAPDPPSPVPPPPPGLPIDGSLIVLVLIALVIGFYKTYKIKKASRLS
jgi:ABC-type antimicrobial peptide transport system permease subunit